MEYVEKDHLTIKQWSVEERPREKMAALGNHALSNAELLAIILGSGTRRETAVELARRVLAKFGGSLRAIGNASLADMMAIRGIGLASATRIQAAITLGRRHRSEEVGKRTKITSSSMAWEIIQPVFGGLEHEEFWIGLLNRANMLIKTVQVSRGGISGTVVDSRMIYSLVLEHKASGIILFHNHPSGNIQPSDADKRLTDKICRIAAVMEVQVLDHIIVGEEKYFSFADHGLIST
ncbi:MAG TPA: DNA repair protein RadC [Bacteroidales bacterium]|nr:DNA repair protein RadC [Bacteroidales bacterium]HRZ49567.1 DNA repair protein RadC [Bacteroidales bacterium]